MRFVVLVACAALLFTSPTSARTIPLGPPGDYNDEQVGEFWIGGLAMIHKLCGFYSESKKLRALARKTPYGREGLRRWGLAEGYAGSCPEAKDYGEPYLKNYSGWESHLEKRYSCSENGCVPRKDSVSATVKAGSDANGKSDDKICRAAITWPASQKLEWSSRSSAQDDVAEAQSRGYSLTDCVDKAGFNLADYRLNETDSTTSGNVEERLEKIQALLDNGLITEAEAEEQRAKVLEDL